MVRQLRLIGRKQRELMNGRMETDNYEFYFNPATPLHRSILMGSLIGHLVTISIVAVAQLLRMDDN